MKIYNLLPAENGDLLGHEKSKQKPLNSLTATSLTFILSLQTAFFKTICLKRTKEFIKYSDNNMEWGQKVKLMTEFKSSRCLNPAQYYKRLHTGISAKGENIYDSVRISDEGKKKLITGHIMAGLMEMVTLKGRKPRS